eukprot:jgi/Tetstr1/465124/TSEL_009847.t1
MEALTVAYYLTGHGLGHATRGVEVCRALVAAGHSVVVVSGAPSGVFVRGVASPALSFRRAVLDVGAVQSDALTLDMKGSLDAYAAIAHEQRATLLETEAAWLRATRADLVVSDVVPLACTAAKMAGIPCVCISNFSWDFVYAEYLLNYGGRQKMVWEIAEDYHNATCLLRLPGYSPMPAFRKVVDIPLVVRKAVRSSQEVRAELGVAAGERLLVFMFGGQTGGMHWKLDAGNLPPGWRCVVCATSAPRDGAPVPDNFIMAPPEAYLPDLINASDCVMGKIGYGATSECLAHRKPLVFVRRDHFNEEPFLRKLLEVHGAAVEMKRAAFLEGHWSAYLLHALTLRPSYREPINGAEVAAQLLESIGRQEEGWRGKTQQGTHLSDTVVWGYLMRAAGGDRDVEVPDWYLPGRTPSTPGQTPVADTEWDAYFCCEHGDPRACRDTVGFLGVLGRLSDDSTIGSEEMSSNEMKAARSLFRWDDDVIVTRAPGRLDVMGGIADYSGSLVLQLPLREACHVAAQLQPPGRQRVWRHMEEAQRQNGAEAPAIRVVSLYADDTNRAPTFDIYLSELQGADGGPLDYDAARALFRRDPAQSWAAYIVGCLVVLMREKGLPMPASGLSLLVASEVPEGKGVSSSAAVEVSTMMALCQLYGMEVGGRELALLCQKVENAVVGAPCGVMDQMTSALGRAGHLMLLQCQPAEVQGFLPLPPHVAVWGLDSGIRHAVVGTDYGLVRTGAFMGHKIASTTAASSVPPARETNAEESAGEGGEEEERVRKAPRTTAQLPGTLLGGGYLANVSPSEFSLRYAPLLPREMAGSEFLARFGPHADSSTEVVPEQMYAVLEPAAHPVHENFRVKAFEQVMLAPRSSSQDGDAW